MGLHVHDTSSSETEPGGHSVNAKEEFYHGYKRSRYRCAAET